MTLTTHIKAGFQRQLKTEVVFVYLSAAYETVAGTVKSTSTSMAASAKQHRAT
jgi:hypothetical protein